MLRAFGCFGAALIAALLWIPSAHAAPRTVAIVNLSHDDNAAAAAGVARKILDETADLAPNPAGDLARALEDAVPEGGPDAPVLAAVATALDKSDESFRAFKSRQVQSELRTARRLLYSLPPSKATSDLLADVSFRLALLHLREQNRGLAMSEFMLLHRLAPERKAIDPARFAPDVVKAYREAQRLATRAKPATISVSATYDGAPVFVDGKAAGSAPAQLQVSAGPHVIAVAAPQYQATAEQINVDAGDSLELKIDLAPRSSVSRALALRYEMLAAAPAEQREAIRVAAARTARLTGSDAVAVIVDDHDSAMIALYDPRIDRISYRHAPDDGLRKMLGLVLEVGSPPLVEDRPLPKPPPWYLRPWGVAAWGGGAAAIGLVSIFALSGNSQVGDRTLTPDLSQLGGMAP